MSTSLVAHTGEFDQRQVEKPHYVYTLSYPDGGVFYVGKGIGDRIDEHEKEAKRGDDRNPYKNNIIRKIWDAGEQVVKTILAYFKTEKEAHWYEIATIILMKGYGHLTNLTDGGEGCWGWEPSEEWRLKQGEVRRGRPGKPLTEEQRRKLGESHRMSIFAQEQRRDLHEANKGRKLPPRTEEWRRMKSEVQKGKSLPEETRRRMSEAHTGITHTEESRRKIGEANSSRLWSDESRRKLSEAAKRRKGQPGKPHTEASRLKISEARKRTEAAKQRSVIA